ncbi:hypothetical protein NKDENANG_04042 [Candidatus Entotheonellaceae bacterium PAL068K]
MDTLPSESTLEVDAYPRPWYPVLKATQGRRRLDHADDFVQQETALALALGKTVLSVLFDDTPMPLSNQLPEPGSLAINVQSALHTNVHLFPFSAF